MIRNQYIDSVHGINVSHRGYRLMSSLVAVVSQFRHECASLESLFATTRPRPRWNLRPLIKLRENESLNVRDPGTYNKIMTIWRTRRFNWILFTEGGNKGRGMWPWPSRWNKICLLTTQPPSFFVLHCSPQRRARNLPRLAVTRLIPPV